MSTEIYYFSGTGNSLFAARELQGRIPCSRLIPIAGLLDKHDIRTNGRCIGIVFPVHALTIPIAVKRFIKNTDISSAEYIFAVATRYGTVFRGFEKVDRLLKKKNKRLDSHFILNMCSNEPRHKGYNVPSESDVLSCEKVVLEKLDLIRDIVTTRGISREKDTEYFVESASNPVLGYLIEKVVVFLMDIAEYFGGVNYFYYDDKCIGCGTCEKVCLSKKIKMVEQRPTWQKNILCYMCFACLNYCPQESVQINDIPGVKSYTKESGRYPHPYATVKDISNQKGTEEDCSNDLSVNSKPTCHA